MNRSIFSFFGCFLLALLLSLSSCRQEKSRTAESNATAFENSLNNSDTTDVINLVDTFFGYLEQGQVADAVAMLFTMDNNNPHAEPQLLDNEQIARTTSLFSAFPIVGHRIDYIKFRETYNNEVKVTAIIQEAQDGMPEMTTSFVFKPYDYLSVWRLCTFNTEVGDRRIVSHEDADSVGQRLNGVLSDRASD